MSALHTLIDRVSGTILLKSCGPRKIVLFYMSKVLGKLNFLRVESLLYCDLPCSIMGLSLECSQITIFLSY